MLLNIARNTNASTFEADVDGIHELQATFVASSPKFLYLRKGEHSGAPIIAAFYALCIRVDWDKKENIPSEVRQDAKDLTAAVQRTPWFLKVDRSNADRIQDYKIISIEEHDTIRAKKLNDELNVQVKFIPKEEKHFYRFYLTDTKYAFFIRHGDDQNARFWGHLGSDTDMISNLKKRFLIEWG